MLRVVVPLATPGYRQGIGENLRKLRRSSSSVA
jgi:hypothetical protein